MFLFLDIDGVLNTRDMWNKMFTFDTKKVLLLADFLKKYPDIRIVITSSWRKGFEYSTSKNNADYIKELEKYIKISAATPVTNTSRDIDIGMFLKKHPAEYIIIDDDENEFQRDFIIKNKNKFIFCDARNGLTEKNIKELKERMKLYE